MCLYGENANWGKWRPKRTTTVWLKVALGNVTGSVGAWINTSILTKRMVVIQGKRLKPDETLIRRASVQEEGVEDTHRVLRTTQAGLRSSAPLERGADSELPLNEGNQEPPRSRRLTCGPLSGVRKRETSPGRAWDPNPRCPRERCGSGHPARSAG